MSSHLYILVFPYLSYYSHCLLYFYLLNLGFCFSSFRINYFYLNFFDLSISYSFLVMFIFMFFVSDKSNDSESMSDTRPSYAGSNSSGVNMCINNTCLFL